MGRCAIQLRENDAAIPMFSFPSQGGTGQVQGRHAAVQTGMSTQLGNEACKVHRSASASAPASGNVYFLGHSTAARLVTWMTRRYWWDPSIKICQWMALVRSQYKYCFHPFLHTRRSKSVLCSKTMEG